MPEKRRAWGVYFSPARFFRYIPFEAEQLRKINPYPAPLQGKYCTPLAMLVIPRHAIFSGLAFIFYSRG
jgi:hypothetical protein